MSHFLVVGKMFYDFGERAHTAEGMSKSSCEIFILSYTVTRKVESMP
jgi:hypothetical protein